MLQKKLIRKQEIFDEMTFESCAGLAIDDPSRNWIGAKSLSLN